VKIPYPPVQRNPDTNRLLTQRGTRPGELNPSITMKPLSKADPVRVARTLLSDFGLV
jgi:hypothetical protein